MAQDAAAFLLWISVVLWLQLQHSLIQGLRDRAGILNWRRGFGRTYQVVSRTAARNATAADRSLSPGAAGTMATGDAFAIGFLPIVIGSLAASVVSYAVVGVLLLRASPLLGVLVLVGVPVFSGLLFVLARPLRERQEQSRVAAQGMNDVAGDAIRGLRVLRGIGGEASFLARYRARSAEARRAGIRVSWPVAGVEAIKIAVSGVLLIGLTWIGAALVANGQLLVGELVAFYGYAGFLVLPVTLVAQAVTAGVQAHVGARRIVGLLGVAPLVTDASDAVGLPPSAPARPILDAASGVGAAAGEHVGVAPAAPADARAIADRLARLVPAGDDEAGTVGGRDVSGLRVDDVRREVVVADAVPFLFAGTLRSLLDPDARHLDDEILAAVAAADATDIVAAVEGGLDGTVGERAREFSGGQRQRLGLARALLRADAGALVLLEPTSSVDAVTRGAHRGGRARASRETHDARRLDQRARARRDRPGRSAGRGRHAGGIRHARRSAARRGHVSRPGAAGGGARMTTLPVASGAHVRRTLAAIARAHAGAFAIVVALYGIGAIAGLLPPWLIGRLIDELTLHSAGLADVAMFGASMSAALAVQVLALLWATRRTLVLGEIVFATLRDAFMAGALRLPIGLVESAGTGDLINRTTQDIGAVSSTARFALPQMLIASVSIVLTVVAGFLVSPLIAPVFLVGLPMLVVVGRWYLRRAVPIYFAESAAFGPIFGAVYETVEGGRTVDALRLADSRDAAADRALAGYWRATVPVIGLHMVMLPTTNLAFALPVAAALGWGGWLATNDLVTVGAVSALTLFATQLIAPFETIMRDVDELQGGLVAFSRVLGVSEAAAVEEPADVESGGVGAGTAPRRLRVSRRPRRPARRRSHDDPR